MAVPSAGFMRRLSPTAGTVPVQEPDADPQVDKIIINMGLGEAIQNIKILDSAAAELAQIAGKNPSSHAHVTASPPSS